MRDWWFGGLAVRRRTRGGKKQFRLFEQRKEKKRARLALDRPCGASIWRVPATRKGSYPRRRARVHRLDWSDAKKRRDRGRGGKGFHRGALRGPLRLGTRRRSGRSQQRTTVLHVREDEYTGLRARCRREERGGSERQHRRWRETKHRRGERGRVAQDAVAGGGSKLSR